MAGNDGSGQHGPGGACHDPTARQMALEARGVAQEAKGVAQEALDGVQEIARDIQKVRGTLMTVADTALRVEARIVQRFAHPEEPPPMRPRAASHSDIEELRDDIEELRDEVKTSPGMHAIPGPAGIPSERVREVVAHQLTERELQAYRAAEARRWHVILGVTVAVMSGVILFLLTHHH